MWNKLFCTLLAIASALPAVCQKNIAPQIPSKAEFAGQSINLSRFDLYERMDREMLSLMFGHTNTFLTIKRANRYEKEIKAELKRQGVPEDFFYLAAIESHFDNTAISPAKAVGIWQFVPSTAKEYGMEVNQFVDERYDYMKATRSACRYLKKAYAQFKCWLTVAASYNAGMGRISKTISSQKTDSVTDLFLNKETSRYIFRLLAMKLIMENPAGYGFSVTDGQLYSPIACNTVKVTGTVDSWVDWAKQHNTTYYLLREMNPWIRNDSLPNTKGKTYYVRIPKKTSMYRSTL